MIDVRIVHSAARETTARQIEEALAQAGYRAAATRVGMGEDSLPAWDGGASLFLWDRSSINLPAMRAAATTARRGGRAIDVSADGITPLGLDDDRSLIPLSGWRGESFHPGWTRILAEVNRLCGEGKGSHVPLGTDHDPRSAPTPASVQADRGRRGPTGLSARPLTILGIVLLVLIGAVTALSWRSRPGPLPTTPVATPTPPRAAHAPPPPAAAPPVSGGAPNPAGLPTYSPAGEADAASAVPTSSGHAQPARGRHARAARAEPTPHYTRYAGIMRLFCRRSGRGTPECRVFERAFHSRR